MGKFIWALSVISKRLRELQIKGVIKVIFFLFLHENTYCGYSLEAPQWGASNEYPQHVFSWRNKKILKYFSVYKVF